MKFVLLACLVALAAAAPQHGDKQAVVSIDSRIDEGDGNFQYTFQTSNGIFEYKAGTPGSKGQSNMNGNFKFRHPDGTSALVEYVADEFGYQPKSDLLPKSPPLPEHVYALLEIAEDQRARGITFEK